MLPSKSRTRFASACLKPSIFSFPIDIQPNYNTQQRAPQVHFTFSHCIVASNVVKLFGYGRPGGGEIGEDLTL
jgi:hypothetical protein